MAPSKKSENRRRAQALVRGLEGNEKLLERLEAVVEVAHSEDSCGLDEVEGKLIGLLRELGSESLGSWAGRREEALAGELRQEHGALREREKKRSTSIRALGESK